MTNDDVFAARQSDVIAGLRLHSGQNIIRRPIQVKFNGVAKLDLVIGKAPAALLKLFSEFAADW
jgi:hypothetical protein